MQPAYRVDEVRVAEAALMATVPDGDLMRRAAFGLAGVCIDLLGEIHGAVYGSRVLLLVGSGNNGGDALFAGALLARRGAQVEVLCVGERPHPDGLAAVLRAGGRVTTTPQWSADLIVDGLVGIGASGALREPLASVAIATAEASGCVVAVDVPSGVDPNEGLVPGVAVAADVTVTFGCIKPGLLVMPALDYVGRLIVVDIGLDPYLSAPAAYVLDHSDIAHYLRAPDRDAHKYARGVAGIAAGSERYPGAAVLCVGAARTANVGMVEILDRRDGVSDIVRERFPDVVVADSFRDERVTAWGVGSGFTGDASDDDTIAAALAESTPVVCDAGALTAMARNTALRALVRDRSSRGIATAMTPHDGEFARLASTVSTLPEGRIAATVALAAEFGCTIVRKGPGTIVSDGVAPPFIDVFGTPALATAGSGDVLTGLCAAFWAASETCDAEAIAAAVGLHGIAGQQSAGTALDLLDAIPEAIVDIEEAR